MTRHAAGLQAVRMSEQLISDDEILDARAASAWLHVSVRTLDRWRAQRIGPDFIKMSARAIRYRLCDLRTWREGRTVKCDE
jgi:hypothetical protein